jgi:hypothetical protein
LPDNKAPTREIGYAQASVLSGSNSTWWMYEDETTPELIWPQSVRVFDQMRTTDSQVQSVLRAVTHPLLRTPWRVNPAGARAEVTQFVADDLGLPVVGKAPTPLPRTRDRFSWTDHLNHALLMLPFGHSFFEQVYRIDETTSQAHLRKLAPRLPKTIDEINVARDGGLISIRQYASPGSSEQKPIPVDRLVAYVHQKEGGNWLGRSILRAGYKNWLLKDRLLRVQAQTIERNGMGIPTYTAAETEKDLSTGLAMATTLRSGEAAGAALPFGATLKLMGVEGQLPDAEPAIRYHDEQLARAVLAHFLNLGTQTGSWALGSTFADFFVLSLQMVAQQIADVATQHIVEDLVDLNFGENEPAPKIVFDEIGSRQAATAEAIKALIDAGVISPDDVLEGAVRQQYGLPPRDEATERKPPEPAGPAPQTQTQPDERPGSVAAAAGPDDAGPKEVEAHLKGLHDQSSHGRKGRKLADELNGQPATPPAPAKAPRAPAQKAAPKAAKTPKGLKGPGSRGSLPARAVEGAVRLTPQSAREMHSAMVADKPWTGGQKDALNAYTAFDYEGINYSLRNPAEFADYDEDLKQDVGRQIRSIQAAMRPLPKSVKVTRAADFHAYGIQTRPPEALESLKALKGKTLQEPGFLSTSIEDEAFGGTLPVRLDLDVPAATPVAYLEEVSDNPEEYEMLLGPGTKIKILSVDTAARPVVVKAVVVSPSALKTAIRAASEPATSRPGQSRTALTALTDPANLRLRVVEDEGDILDDPDYRDMVSVDELPDWLTQVDDAGPKEVTAKFDKNQLRDPHTGEWTDAAPGGGTGAIQLTAAEARQMQTQMEASDRPWTAEHTRSLKAWTTPGFHDIRMMIDNPSHEPFLGIGGPATVRAHIRNIHDAMRPLPKPVKVFRKVDRQGIGLGNGDDPKQLVGQVKQNPNFTATSIEPDAGFLGAPRPIHIEIDVPAGTRAAYLEAITETKGEHELLLDAGIVLEFTDATDRGDGVTVLKARVIP